MNILLLNCYLVILNILNNVFNIQAEVATICESGNRKLNCKSGSISVIRAFYGRSRRSACGFNEDWFVFCQINVTSYVKNQCDGRMACELEPNVAGVYSNEMCTSVRKKYLEVVYSCNGTEISLPKANVTIVPKTPLKNETFCERILGKIKCLETGASINIVEVMWGRLKSDVCKTNFQEASSKSCSSNRFLYNIKEQCDGERECIIYPHVDWLGDPCPHSSKYFYVKYQCIKKGTFPLLKETDEALYNLEEKPIVPVLTKDICEGKSSFLFCNKAINIVSARFGEAVGKCNPKGLNFTNCSNDVSKFVKYHCQDEGFCPLLVDAGQLGDPCPNVSKQLRIKYQCLDKDVTTPTPIIIPSVPVATKAPPKTGSCGISKAASARVIDGEFTQRGRWPWQVAIYRSDGSFFCGGSIVDPFWIVTAAHCFMKGLQNAYVVVGDTDRSKIEGSERRHVVEKLVKHDGFDNPYQHSNDIALLKVQIPIMFDEFVSTVCLPDKLPLTSIGNKGYVTGWGRYEYPGKFSIRLREAEMTLVSNQQCASKLRTAPGKPGEMIDDGMICAYSEASQTSCQGDSGGPFVQSNGKNVWFLRGITSWGSPRCEVTDMYLVMTRVEKFVDWIKENMASR